MPSFSVLPGDEGFLLGQAKVAVSATLSFTLSFTLSNSVTTLKDKVKDKVKDKGGQKPAPSNFQRFNLLTF
ncbi:MAG: hypothetical protein C5B50_09285 [Verrucomicrobia bacterium]|nr:MAG: hypothetical protein C5B50_09285 [Verrucomicrobiota bacterium]